MVQKMGNRVNMAGRLPILPQAEFEAEWARRKYVRYCQYVHDGVWIPGRHHRLICDKLDAVVRGEITRLMVWMPPQHGKSMSITETFPSYFLGKNPDLRVIEASYNDTFAKKFGRKNREKIDQYGQRLWGISLSPINRAAAHWDIAGHRGGMLSVGIGGAATGEGADCLIFDDPTKNREEANSKTYRDKLWDEYQSTFKSRVHPGGAIIIVMTRWHEDDLCGRLLNPEYGEVEDWEILKLPALCEDENDALGRAIGEPLWPENGYDAEWVDAQRKSIGSYAFASLYQQRPAPAEGGLFKRDDFRFYTALPDNLNQAIQSWDCTFKEAENNDYVSGQVWAKKGSRYYLLDRIHGRMGITGTMQGIESLAAKWPNARAKCIEDKANGPAVIELLSNRVSGLIPVTPNGGKVARAQAVVAYLEAHNIFLPHPSIAPWVNDYIEEFISFPNAAHDDDVDAMTQAITQLDRLFGNGGGMIYREFSEEPEAYTLPRNLIERRLISAAGKADTETITIGIANANNNFGTAFVATAILRGYKHVFVLSAHVCGGNASPDDVVREFEIFADDVKAMVGKDADYVYLDGANDVVYKAIRQACRASREDTSIRSAIDIPEADRISLTLSLMTDRRLTISADDADALSEAIMVAQWKDGSSKTKRSDDSAANTVVLQAFERSIETSRRYLIAREA